MKAHAKIAVWDRDGWICHYCGCAVVRADRGVPQSRWATVDHLTPKIRGGSGRRENLVTACMPCNARKKDRTAEEYLAWWLERTDSEETRL